MKSLLNSKDTSSIFKRIDVLSEDDLALWGKMNASQNLCHLADQLRLITGEKTSEDHSTFFRKTILKKLVLWGLPTPKGKVTTAPSIDSFKGGTQPTNFEKDKAILKTKITEVLSLNKDQIHPHPLFGKMTKKEWMRLAYIHLDYHLDQFGV